MLTQYQKVKGAETEERARPLTFPTLSFPLLRFPLSSAKPSAKWYCCVHLFPHFHFQAPCISPQSSSRVRLSSPLLLLKSTIMGSIGRDPADLQMQTGTQIYTDESSGAPSSSALTKSIQRQVGGARSVDWETSASHCTNSRGRSNRKRSQTRQENVCVVAFLIQAQNERQKQVVDQIQEIRRRYDRAYSRWPPHLTLVPPFIAPFVTTSLADSHLGDAAEQQIRLHETLEQVCTTIEAVCRKIDQHTLTLDEVGHFPLKRYKTLHLRPSATANDDAFLRLQSELETALPQAVSNARSQGKSRETYKPHLTLGQSSNDKVNTQLHQQASQVFKVDGRVDEPFRVKVDKIQLMVKPVDRTGPYDIYRDFSLKSI